jgi:hypothetical protein
MQLSVIRTNVYERLGTSSTDPNLSTAVLNNLINASIRAINLMQDWPWLVKTDATLVTTVPGQSSYTPASDHRKTLYIRVGDLAMLTYKTEQDLDRFSSFEGMPRYYTLENGTIRMFPTPEDAYPIRHVYVHNAPAVTTDSAEPIIPDWAIDLLIAYTAMRAAARMRDPELMQLMQEEWRDVYRAMLDETRRSRALPVPQHRTDIPWN